MEGVGRGVHANGGGGRGVQLMEGRGKVRPGVQVMEEGVGGQESPRIGGR